MFAVVKTGGKQYKVAAGDIIQVEKLSVEAGKTVELADVLMLCDGGKVTCGSPLISGAKVACEVVSQSRTGSLIIFKKKRRQNYRRKKHHRQEFTVLKITGISAQERAMSMLEEMPQGEEDNSVDGSFLPEFKPVRPEKRVKKDVVYGARLPVLKPEVA